MINRVVSQFIHYLDFESGNRLNVGDSPAKTTEKLEKMNLPDSLKYLLTTEWFNESCYAYMGFVIWSSTEIADQEDQQNFLNDDMICIGSCANGDLIAFDFGTEIPSVRIIDHGGYWESGAEYPKDYSVLLCGSIGDFFYRIVEVKFIPCDFHDALDYQDFLKERKKEE